MDYNKLSDEKADALIKQEPGTVVQREDGRQFMMDEGRLKTRLESTWSDSVLYDVMVPEQRFRVVSRPNPQPEKTDADELPGMLALAAGVAAGEWPHTMDAKVWAEHWMKQIAETPDIATDEGTMLSWFANAIMAGYDRAMHDVAKEEPVDPVLGAKFVAMIRDRYPDHEAAGQRIEFYRELITDCVQPLIQEAVDQARKDAAEMIAEAMLGKGAV